MHGRNSRVFMLRVPEQLEWDWHHQNNIFQTGRRFKTSVYCVGWIAFIPKCRYPKWALYFELRIFSWAFLASFARHLQHQYVEALVTTMKRASVSIWATFTTRPLPYLRCARPFARKTPDARAFDTQATPTISSVSFSILACKYSAIVLSLCASWIDVLGVEGSQQTQHRRITTTKLTAPSRRSNRLLPRPSPSPMLEPRL